MWVVANITGFFTLCLRQRLKLKVLCKLGGGSTSLVICKRPLRISAGFLENIFWDSVNLLCAPFPSDSSHRPSPPENFLCRKTKLHGHCFPYIWEWFYCSRKGVTWKMEKIRHVETWRDTNLSFTKATKWQSFQHTHLHRAAGNGGLPMPVMKTWDTVCVY